MSYKTTMHNFSTEELNSLERSVISSLLHDYEDDLRIIAFHERKGNTEEYTVRLTQFYKLLDRLKQMSR